MLRLATLGFPHPTENDVLELATILEGVAHLAELNLESAEPATIYKANLE